MAEKPKEVQQRRVMPLSAFDLIKCKINKDGVLVIHQEHGTEGGVITKDGDYLPHPDLQTALDALKLYMATRLGLLEGWDYSRENIKKDPEGLKGAMDGHKKAVERCQVNGITFVGEGDTYGVKISGYLKTSKGDGTGISVPKISFTEEKLGYETEVQELCEKITAEVYKYRFQAKKLQTDINTEIEKQEHPELFVEPGEETTD